MARREVIQIRCSEAEKDKWNAAATAQNLDLSGWIRLMLDRATRPGGTPIVAAGGQTQLDATGLTVENDAHQVGKIERPFKADFKG